MNRPFDIRRMTLAALMAALIFVLTVLPRIPTPVGGYIHLGDVGITFAALAFGPWVAALAGGMGTALADLSAGYAQFALASLLVHGLQGWLMGLLVRRRLAAVPVLAAVLVGTVVLVGGYFLAEVVLLSVAVALTEIPLNIVQGLVGGLVGVSLYFAVARAYPPLRRYRAS